MKYLFLMACTVVFFSNVSGQNNSADTLTKYILTPPESEAPHINGAKVFGVRPGSPFLFTIPASGIRPMNFSAIGLPKGLKLDSTTGRISGSLKMKGNYTVKLQAQNAKGKAIRNLKIVVGETIALTPPMGWNSWNCFASKVTGEEIKRTADAMLRNGLINHGWTYVNIDDFWENNHIKTGDSSLQGDFRDAAGKIFPNKRFPDMKGLVDHIHGLGLKAGLYSSPGEITCGGCAGSWQHEMQDAKTFADWGFDYLKYDFCSYDKIINDSTKGVPHLTHKGNDSIARSYPFELMGKALKAQNRDIVYSLSAGMPDIWKWASKVNANCWRTSGDVGDAWEIKKGRFGEPICKVGFDQYKYASYTSPGHYNDPDMLVIGQIGWGKPRPTSLTANEQYFHISLWCLLSAPLMLGCDLDKLDPFTLNLITNDEVLEVDQDPLCKPSTTIRSKDSLVVITKELENGAIAMGLFNRNNTPIKMNVSWQELGIKGQWMIRDLWRQKDMGVAIEKFETEVNPHGVVLVKLIKSAKSHK